MATGDAPKRNISGRGPIATPFSLSSAKLAELPRRLSLFRRCTVWCPTRIGFFIFAAGLSILALGWFRYGESLLEVTHRLPAEVLVVEGWIGRDGIKAAVSEFQHGGYQLMVSAGGLTSGRWEDQPTSYAEMAAREMIRVGVPRERLIIATAERTESHRTFESAVAVWEALKNAGIHPKALNVFTSGPHARRSALVFAKVNSPGIAVGVVGWILPDYKSQPWWRSSERAKDLLTETAGYLFEALLNSGRVSNHPRDAVVPDFVQTRGSRG
jgi:uncharacterized SAM-binding protein YcdF (DUF218 family)